MNNPRILFWHRKDLRISDNLALIKAFSISNAITSIQREIQEETGFSANKWDELGTLVPALVMQMKKFIYF